RAPWTATARGGAIERPPTRARAKRRPSMALEARAVAWRRMAVVGRRWAGGRRGRPVRSRVARPRRRRPRRAGGIWAMGGRRGGGGRAGGGRPGREGGGGRRWPWGLERWRGGEWRWWGGDERGCGGGAQFGAVCRDRGGGGHEDRLESRQ